MEKLNLNWTLLRYIYTNVKTPHQSASRVEFITRIQYLQKLKTKEKYPFYNYRQGTLRQTYKPAKHKNIWDSAAYLT